MLRVLMVRSCCVHRLCDCLRGCFNVSLTILCLTSLLLVHPVRAEDVPLELKSEDAKLASELTNPLADLLLIPIEMIYDQDIGPEDEGWKLQTNIKPVIPFHLSEEWNLISRTVIPVTHQEDIFPGAGSQFGLGDIVQTMFFSPKEPTPSGIIWGIGPALLFPTASDSLLGTEKWGAGPGAIVLKKRGSWTVGIHTNHIWSFAGESDRADVNNTLLQPFVAYTWPSAWTASIQSESNYNWQAEEWGIPVDVALSELFWLGPLPVQLRASIGYWAASRDAGPEGFRSIFQTTFVLPK